MMTHRRTARLTALETVFRDAGFHAARHPRDERCVVVSLASRPVSKIMLAIVLDVAGLPEHRMIARCANEVHVCLN